MALDGLCEQKIPRHMLMCKPHWFMVPKPTRTTIWETWGGGVGVLDPEYEEAVKAAREAVKAKIEAKSSA